MSDKVIATLMVVGALTVFTLLLTPTIYYSFTWKEIGYVESVEATVTRDRSIKQVKMVTIHMENSEKRRIKMPMGVHIQAGYWYIFDFARNPGGGLRIEKYQKIEDKSFKPPLIDTITEPISLEGESHVGGEAGR